MLGRLYYPYFTGDYKATFDIEVYIQVRLQRESMFLHCVKQLVCLFVVKYTLLASTEKVPLLSRQVLKILPFIRPLYHHSRRRYSEPSDLQKGLECA